MRLGAATVLFGRYDVSFSFHCLHSCSHCLGRKALYITGFTASIIQSGMVFCVGVSYSSFLDVLLVEHVNNSAHQGLRKDCQRLLSLQFEDLGFGNSVGFVRFGCAHIFVGFGIAHFSCGLGSPSVLGLLLFM